MREQNKNHYLVARFLGGVILAIVLVIFGLILANAFYSKNTTRFHSPQLQPANSGAVKQALATKNPVENEKNQYPIKTQAKYSFYEQLQRRSREVQAEVAQKTAAQKKRQPIKGKNYRIQIGAFRDKDQAEQLRARMILRDMPVEIIRSKSYFLVQIGPYANKTLALKVQKKLERENMDTILKTFVDD